ncbi:DUF2529 domain-containing protein [Cytobacillus sp. IB215665]|uniref:DUF2529 domain-containing protein n=1 Tax=Cytobacillus sp. IB215665 TaxID=3097357 RepID=UPI002A11A4C9|nr:DUF2529 domain-containing protein [Cytobacillus sp. IB215665]MDX8363667.1 DUF2529 domain-containing protein [Cytobacillus sp. IB215665]
MLKIFTTQLTGLFKKITDNEEDHIEDGARLLAQAIIGDGSIYVLGIHEMEAIAIEASIGTEPLPKIKRLSMHDDFTSIHQTDRVLLVTRYSTDEKAIESASSLMNLSIPIVAISADSSKENETSLTDLVDVHIDTKLIKPLIPNSDGTRFGLPTMMAALFAYYGLAYTIEEIIDEN